MLNVEPIYKSKAEVDLSNQNDTEETNNYITNGYETNGISNKEFWNPETGNDENKEKSYEGMSKNVKVSISDAPKTDMDDITSEEIASRVHQPIPQTTVNLLKSSNKQQEAIKFSESKVIESDDTTWNEADRHGVILSNGSKSTVSHKNSSDGEVEEETDEQKSKSNQSRARHEALEAKTNNPENKATSSMHEEQISVGVHTSETDKRLHVTEKPRVTTLTIDDSKTEKRTGAKNPTSLSQMSLVSYIFLLYITKFIAYAKVITFLSLLLCLVLCLLKNKLLWLQQLLAFKNNKPLIVMLLSWRNERLFLACLLCTK